MKKLTILTLFFSLLVFAATAGFGEEVMKTANADLNGDGIPDKISFTLNRAMGGFALFVNETSVIGKFKDADINGFFVVDVKRYDPYKEIAVISYGEGYDYEYLLFRYDGSTIKEMGGFSGLPSYSGNGIVMVNIWMGFWSMKEKYLLDDSSGRLNHVSQELYYVGIEATVKESFPVYKTRGEKNVVAETLPTSKILIIACDPSPKCEDGGDFFCDWYLVKTNTGLIGWVRLKTLSDKLESLPWAG
ncbi:MAG: hypothetical protein JW984_04380 [Deltaproteobacteria bacterium]|uniref:SH3 domain-containing protein n=1 Tax=Candidatus Zymogenus saltonus TaxID=2844893 RepID=A0A9D8KDV3_9DELT|nr:hypothetical protein [Candidatus Zymogenus saltonus]